jgi:hypothetical protein
MAKIKGKWRWNPKVREVSVGEEFRCAVNITTEQGTYHYIQIASAGTNQVFPSLSGGTVSGPLIGYGLPYFNGILSITSGSDGQGNVFVKEEYRFMDFGETEQEVSDEFYNYLVANATPSTIAEKLTLIAENQQKVFDAGYTEGETAGYGNGYEVGVIDGKQAEYDAFWDAFQNYGNRIDYATAFGGVGWTQEMLENIKYPITFIAEAHPHQCYTKSIFYYLNYAGKTPIDMTNVLSKFDFSNCQRVTQTFANAYVTNVTLDLSNCDKLDRLFVCSDAGGKTCENVTLKVSEKCRNYMQAFYYCSGLTELRFMEGSVIAANIEFAQSKNLTRASIESIVNALSTTTSGLTATFSKVAVDKAFETSEGANDGSTTGEWLPYTATARPNWNFSLV